MQQGLINQAEDYSVRADAQSQGKDGDRSERGFLE
jgi:hypothetical protein